jgi:hypothetical protein
MSTHISVALKLALFSSFFSFLIGFFARNIEIGERLHPASYAKKLKLKQSHYTPRRSLGERMYSSYSFLTSALDGVSCQRHAPAAL